MAEKAAKVGIVAAVVGLGLTVLVDTVLEEKTAAWTAAEIAAMIVVWGGVLASSSSLFKAWRRWDKNTALLAAVGLLLNGGLLAMGFVKSPIGGILDTGPKKLSAKESEAPPASTQSRRAIVTKDWTAGSVIGLTDTDFDEVVNGSDIPVLVDFWASWCGPCRKMSPIIEDVARDYAKQVKVCKLNVDSARKVASKFNIRGIPTIILFKAGRVQEKWVGLTSKQAISATIDKLLQE
jgi:thioredoxin 1